MRDRSPAEVVLAQGERVAKVARRLGAAEQPYYRCRGQRELSGDAVIWGQPGVGKTFLIEALCADGWGLFLRDGDSQDRVVGASAA